DGEEACDPRAAPQPRSRGRPGRARHLPIRGTSPHLDSASILRRTFMHPARWLLVLAGLSLLALPASAGQVRIDVASNSFINNDVSVNLGDQVVWVWTGSGHTVTSGTGGIPDGLFASGSQQGILSNGGTAFAWKSSALGNKNYFCIPHFSLGMTAVLRVMASGVAVSDFRITEVQYGANGGADRIEIANLGDAPGDLGRYRISISGVATELDIVPVNTLSVPVGGRVTIHTNEAGANTATNLFMSGIGDLNSANGSVA